MFYKQYGKTGKKVSCVGFGGMRFDTRQSLEANADLVRYACAQGINYFDTAPDYCQDQSEDIFGLAFRDMPSPFFVSTKAMPTACNTAQKAKDMARRQIERLGVEKINFYHIWCLRKMAHYELAMRPGGQFEGLLELQEEGLIEHIVCSSHQPGYEIRRIVQEGKVEGVLLGLNILNFPYRWDGVEAAYARGVGVVAMNPLFGGAIPQHEKELAFLAEEGETPTEAALRFVMDCPEISVALVGLSSREQIDMACRIADQIKPFSTKNIERIRARLSDKMNAGCTGCNYCEGCPQGVPVAAYMQYYNEKQLFGSCDETMKKGLAFQHNWGLVAHAAGRAGDCTQCGHCEDACTQRLPIVERMKEFALWER